MARKVMIEVETREGPEMVNLEAILHIQRSGTKSCRIDYRDGNVKKIIRCIEPYMRVKARIENGESKL